ncbi:hypothetical protein EXIGLDRAFT_767413 [Exidia glandulosa HHB12029]|uniref:Uncharacterized protein n=1 Tax=Exidia glandulosa HHB12029 TaxID=1314781 RepID=A0A166AQ96_EXIGL|nr:hypothetical protein EXIGLDRAFT_767413 [Exidia glandulosa HHB12029]
MLVVFMLSALPKGKDPSNDTHKKGLRTVLKLIDTHEPSELGDQRTAITSFGLKNWQDALHEDAAEFAPFFARMGKLLGPDYAIAQPEPDPYNLHEAMQRLLLQEIWRMKDANETFPLDSAQRDYHYDTSEYSATRPGTLLKRTADAESREHASKAKKKARTEEKEAARKKREEDLVKAGARRSTRLKEKK